MHKKKFSFLWLLISLSFFIQPVYSADFVSIKINKAILYEGPSDATDKEFIITEGYPLMVMVRLKDWLKVKDHEGKISWINANDTDKQRTVMTLKKNVNLFYKPTTNSVHLANIDEFVTLKLLSTYDTNGWVEVKTITGYIEGYIRKEDVWGF